MQTIIHPTNTARRVTVTARAPADYRQPIYDCQAKGDALKLVVYVPGVEASGVGIEARGPDLIVTARKPRPVRVNWQSLQLEHSQADYRLSLRLGRGMDYQAMTAEIHQGVLTVVLPKRRPAAARPLLLEKKAIYGT